MIKKIVVTVIASLFICLMCINAIMGMAHKNNILEPEVVFKDYQIYDITNQKNVKCDGSTELLDSDTKYYYYLECKKSDEIFLVNDRSAVTLKEAYTMGLINKNELYSLGLVERISR